MYVKRIETAVDWLIAFFQRHSGAKGRHMWGTEELRARWSRYQTAKKLGPDDFDAALTALRDARRGPRLVCTDGEWWMTTNRRAPDDRLERRDNG